MQETATYQKTVGEMMVPSAYHGELRCPIMPASLFMSECITTWKERTW